MAINPMNLLKLKDRLRLFNTQHPKFTAFLKAVDQQVLEPGAILAVTVTGVDGKKLETNIRLTEDDIETIRMFRN